MKRNDSNMDFSLPQRQSYVAILQIIYRTYSVIFRQLLPVLVVIFLGRSSSKDYIVYGVIAIAIVSMITSIIGYYRFTFYMEDDELIIEKGILTRKKISIPIQRVQTINFEENLIHKLFRVVRLKADTAGSEDQEFSLDAVDKDVGVALQDILLRYKNSTVKAGSSNEEITSLEKLREQEKTILQLPFGHLLKVGLVQNHLRSSGLIFAFFFYLYFNLAEVGIQLEDYKDQLPTLTWTTFLFTVGIVLILIISLIISLVRTVITYYDLHVRRSGKGFRYTAGLFNQKTVSALDQKIQKISWSDNLLMKLLRIFNVTLEQAGSTENSDKKSIKIPACEIHHIEQIYDFLYPDFDPESYEFKGISKKWLIRMSAIWSIITVILSILVWRFNSSAIILVLLIGVLMIVQSILSYRKASYAYDDYYMVLKGGVFGDKKSVFPIYKLQAVSLHDSPYMRRHGLASVRFAHASGNSRLIYIPKVDAQRIVDHCLFIIENSRKKWM